MKANEIVTAEEMKALLTESELEELANPNPHRDPAGREPEAGWAAVVRTLQEQIDALNHRVTELERTLLSSAATLQMDNHRALLNRNSAAPFGIGASLAAESASRYMAAALEPADAAVPIHRHVELEAPNRTSAPAQAEESLEQHGSDAAADLPTSRLERYSRKKTGIRKFFG